MFDILYKKNKKNVLFLIGDPKQAIYSFRGSDIFSYLYAKYKVKKQFYLDTNWRSSIDMCKSINLLFTQNKNPFIYKNILFSPIIPSSKNSKMDFKLNNISQVPISFFLQEKKEVNIDEYHSWISKQCSNEISYWLTCAKQGKAKITTKNGEKILKPNDIAILVRNYQEADLIKKELKKRNINSVYSSDKNSIFQTFDATELLWILESILEPDNEKLLQKSISTHILKNILSIKEKKIKNEKSYFLIEKLYEYYEIWKKIGIFHMIQNMILEFQKNSNFLEQNINYEKNLNFIHIAELLQERFQYFNKKKYLIRWLQKKIIQKKSSSCDEYIKYINKSESVTIITIHKSKGLEYPIVWIPFSIDFNKSKLPIYHNKENFKIFFDIEQKDESVKQADEERLAEDIRLLYVALTRSILHCSIGIACLKKNTHKSNIHESGLGYTVQNGRYMNYESLFNRLNEFRKKNLIEVKQNAKNFILTNNIKNIYLILQPNFLNKKIKNVSNITSFTKLKIEDNFLRNKKKEILLENFINKDKLKNSNNLTIHNFPIGKTTGLLMHDILKNINFLNQYKHDFFYQLLEKYNISTKWVLILMNWINNIINTPFNKKNIILSKIDEKLSIKEMEFFLPVEKRLYSIELNKIIQNIDPLSMMCPKLFFNPFTGILKGCIDLVFYWKNKYYILDYKSNWLGENNNYYSSKYITKEMIKQRYDLQYQIYTIAIHKYLKNKIKNYNYKSHFGGVFYIFLRAIGDYKKNDGIFYTVPDFSMIKNMILLIS